MQDFDPNQTGFKPVYVDGLGMQRLQEAKVIRDKNAYLAQLVYKRADRYATVTIDYLDWLRDGETVAGARAYVEQPGMELTHVRYNRTSVNLTFGISGDAAQYTVNLVMQSSKERVRGAALIIESRANEFIDGLLFAEVSPLPIILPVPASIFALDVTYDPDSGTEPEVIPQRRPEVSVSVTSIAFPDVPVNGSSAERAIIIESTGTDSLALTAIGITGQFKMRGAYPPFLAPGQSVALYITFNPETEGQRLGNVRIVTNALDSPHNVTLSGLALPENTGNEPSIVVEPARMQFNEVVAGETGPFQTLKVTNVGTGLLRTSGVTNTGPFVKRGLLGDIPAGESRSMEVAFSPTEQGFVTGTLLIKSNDAARPTVQVGLSGTGTAKPSKLPFAQVTPAQLAFPQQQSGYERTLNVEVMNLGDSTLVLGQPTVTGAGFSVSAPASQSVQPGERVLIPVTLKSSVIGQATGSMTIPSNATNAPNVVPLAGRILEPTPIRYLHAEGRKLKDADGRTVLLKSCNWYGTESIRVPAGLWSKPYKSITREGITHEGVLDTIARMGFNSIRLPICQDVTFPGNKPNGTGIGWDSTFINPLLNPDLFDPNGGDPFGNPQPFLTSMQIMDRIVAHCRTLNMRVVIDMHCAAPNTDNITGLAGKWYTTAHPDDPGSTTGAEGEPRNEEQMMQAWEFLAAHYLGDPVVCAFDLANEPFNSNWTSDPELGIAGFYERCAARIQAINPDVMIICEGIGGQVKDGVLGTWWGGNLSFVKDRPVVIPIQNKLMYSPHEYGSYQAGTFSQPWFKDAAFPSNMWAIWRQQWGIVAEENIAPLWIGEFGATLRPHGTYTAAFVDLDQKWLKTLAEYFKAFDVNFAYWSINPPGEPTGILEMEQGVWGDPMPEKVEALKQFLDDDPGPIDDALYLATESNVYLTTEDGLQLVADTI